MRGRVLASESAYMCQRTSLDDQVEQHVTYWGRASALALILHLEPFRSDGRNEVRPLVSLVVVGEMPEVSAVVSSYCASCSPGVVPRREARLVRERPDLEEMDLITMTWSVS